MFKKLSLLFLFLMILSSIGCSTKDPFTESFYTKGHIYSWNGTAWNDITLSSNSSGVSNHALLSNLDYASSGHTGFQQELGFTPENIANKGIANGYASLNATGKVPLSELPTAGTGTVTSVSGSGSIHSTGGNDPIIYQDAITSQNVTSALGFSPGTSNFTLTYSGNATQYLDGTGNWTTPSANVTTTYYHLNNLVVQVGTLSSGTVADLQAVGGTDVVVNEQAGTPGFQIAGNFTSVTITPVSLMIYGNYNGSEQHEVYAQLYNYTTASWVNFIHLDTSTNKVWYEATIFNAGDYMSSGNVSFRIVHTSNGNNSHNITLDYISLSSQSSGVGKIAHSALSGLLQDDHTQYSLVNGTRGATITSANVTTALGIDPADNVTAMAHYTSTVLHIPTLTGNAGKILTTDATTPSWMLPTSTNITAWGGQASITTVGILKGAGGGSISQAVAGGDYAPAIGSSNITTLGTIATGTWSATSIAENKGGFGADISGIGTGIVKRTGVNTWVIATAGGDYAPSIGSSNITTLGTISTGVWNGTAVVGQYGGTGVANTGLTITLGANQATGASVASSGNYDVLFTRMTANDATSLQTLQEIRGLYVTLQANKVYLIEAGWNATTTAVTTGITYGASYNGTLTSMELQITGSEAVAAAGTVGMQRISANNTATTVAFVTTSASTLGAIRVSGIVVTGAAAGTQNFSFKQLKVTSGTATALANGWIKATMVK